MSARAARSVEEAKRARLGNRCVPGYEGVFVCKERNVSYGMKMSREFWLVKMDVHSVALLVWRGSLRLLAQEGGGVKVTQRPMPQWMSITIEQRIYTLKESYGFYKRPG
jgi:hypothetical protein